MTPIENVEKIMLQYISRQIKENVTFEKASSECFNLISNSDILFNYVYEYIIYKILDISDMTLEELINTTNYSRRKNGYTEIKSLRSHCKKYLTLNFMCDPLYYMFSWANTPQGIEFWCEKRDDLFKYLLPKPFDLIIKLKKKYCYYG